MSKYIHTKMIVSVFITGRKAYTAVPNITTACPKRYIADLKVCIVYT